VCSFIGTPDPIKVVRRSFLSCFSFSAGHHYRSRVESSSKRVQLSKNSVLLIRRKKCGREKLHSSTTTMLNDDFPRSSGVPTREQGRACPVFRRQVDAAYTFAPI
jgi:hypothetical protein